MQTFLEKFYGLDKAPFPTSGETGPVFLTEPLRQAAERIRQDLDGDAKLITVSGPIGIGKTSLCRALQQLLGQEHQLATIKGAEASWEGMEQALVDGFELKDRELSPASLAEAGKRGRRLVIVVDDAHLLAGEALTSLCNLPGLPTESGDPMLQIILLCDLAQAGSQSWCPLLAWIDTLWMIQLQELPEDAVHAYLDAKLRRAGWRSSPLFVRGGARAIHRLTGGNPRDLSMACSYVLERSSARGLPAVDAAFVNEVLGGESALEAPLPLPEDSHRPNPLDAYAASAWGADLDDAPLTAESIRGARSLELLSGDELLPCSQQVAAVPAPDELDGARPTHRPRPPKRGRSGRRIRPLAFFGIVAVLLALVAYSCRFELVSLADQVSQGWAAEEAPIEAADARSEA